MITIKNLNVTFGKGTAFEKQVLKNINLTVTAGEFVTIIGGNGAGKSTLMNVIAGDIRKFQGEILLGGVDVSKKSTEARAGDIARVFQDPMLGTWANLTIEENLSLALNRGRRFGLKLSVNDEARNLFKERLGKLNMGLEARLADRVALLSGGQRQVLSLVMASLAPSKVILLDEHTAALDPKMAKAVLNLTKQVVEELKLTALMITHSMSHALEYGSRTIMLYHGEIIKDISTSQRDAMTASELLTFFDL
jgi:putative ABC transport system ATP-binding protein